MYEDGHRGLTQVRTYVMETCDGKQSHNKRIEKNRLSKMNDDMLS